MSRSLFALIFSLSILVIFTIACAKVSTPSGGPRDRTPPVVVKSVPPNGSKYFKGKSFYVSFDEYVVLDNINDKFMVSPPMKKKPRIFITGKNVNVAFEDKLKDSTTYTFYFLDAIKDLNEGNILENYKFVFSTGPVVDSLSVTGNVYNALNLEVPEKTIVLLYRELADSAVTKHLPEYISRVDLTGYFRIDNVRPGIYRLYALKDENNSKNYDRKEEEFAFMDSLISVTTEKNFIPVPKDTIPVKKIEKKVAPKGQKKIETELPEIPVLKGQYQLDLFTAQKKDHYLTNSKRESMYQLDYSLSLPPDSMKFEFSIPDISSDKYFIEENKSRDSIKVWLTDSTLYNNTFISTIVKYPFTDTLGMVAYKQDTIAMRFIPPRVPKSVKVKKAKYTVENNLTAGFLKPGQLLVFKSLTPFREPDTSRIKLYETDGKKKVKVAYQLLKDSTVSTKYILKSKLLAGKKYQLITDSAAFGNIYYENTDSTAVNFSLKDPESYSKLVFNISNCEGPCIIELLDNNEKLKASERINKDGKLEFSLLDAGKYRARVIYDMNNDGKWTTGDFTTHRQPEPASYYPMELDIKPGWVLDNQPWDIKMKNVKDQKLRAKPKTTR
jgi:hypothetical protein